MAWLETDRHGRLRIGFKYYDGLKCREPLGVSANKADNRRGQKALRDDTARAEGENFPLCEAISGQRPDKAARDRDSRENRTEQCHRASR
jgi:hypothetical protein